MGIRKWLVQFILQTKRKKKWTSKRGFVLFEWPFLRMSDWIWQKTIIYIMAMRRTVRRACVYERERENAFVRKDNRTHKCEMRPTDRPKNTEMGIASKWWQPKRLASQSISTLNGDSHIVACTFLPYYNWHTQYVWYFYKHFQMAHVMHADFCLRYIRLRVFA